MRGSFSDIIYASWEWTKTILFRPFKPKKWIFLCIIALMSAEFAGCNINLNLPVKKDSQAIVQETQTSPTASDSTADNNFKEDLAANKNISFLKSHVIAIVVILAPIFILLLFLFMWLNSRFNFVFINSVGNNDASIKKPFRENKLAGNSYFKWNILLMLTALCIFALLILILIGGIFLFKDAGIMVGVLLVCVWSISLLSFVIAFVIVCVIVHDLILPIMYKQKITIKQAYKLIAPIFKQEAADIAKYLLIKLALRLGAGIAAAFAAIAIIVVLLIPLGILFGLLYAASLAMPQYMQLGYYILLIALGLICLFAVIVFINVILLPVPVFFRTLSLKFLSRLGDRYNIFKLG